MNLPLKCIPSNHPCDRLIQTSSEVASGKYSERLRESTR